MKKSLSLLLGALLSASQAWAGGLSGGAGLSGGGGGAATSITAGTTTTTCSALQLFYNDSSSKFACMSGTSWNNTNRSLTITGATVTTSNPVLSLTQTWNNAATTFEAVKVNVTQTAAAPASALLDLQVGGASKFNVRQNGVVTAALNFQATAGSIFVANNTGGFFLGTVGDAVLGRNAAASLRLGFADAAAPVAQTLGVQSVVAGTSNTAGVNWTLRGSTSTGSGVAGDIILQTGGTGAGATAQNAFVTALTIKGATQDVVFGKSATFAEMTAPSAPAANGATLYCDDNGAGKTRCSILFATGAAQQFAIEP